MTALEVQVGSTISNGSSCIRVTERVEKDARWGTAGWRGLCIPLEAFGGNAGSSEFVPDYLLSGWYHVPFEWRPCVGGGVEERYVWTADWRRLQREVRRTVQPTVDGIRGHVVLTDDEEQERRRLALAALEVTPLAPVPVDCRSEHGEGHPDCPKCWAWSERNPNARPRPVTP